MSLNPDTNRATVAHSSGFSYVPAVVGATLGSFLGFMMPVAGPLFGAAGGAFLSHKASSLLPNYSSTPQPIPPKEKTGVLGNLL